MLMATTKDYIEYAAPQAAGTGAVRYKKMFGEYMLYVDDKPLLLVCDSTVFVKKYPVLEEIMKDAPLGYPYSPEKYPGVQKHYILDIDDQPLVRRVIAALLPVVPVPKPRKKKAEATG